MVLHRYHIHHGKYIHWNIGIKIWRCTIVTLIMVDVSIGTLAHFAIY